MPPWYKEKTKINFIIDAIMLVMLMAMAGIGFLIKYILLPGFKRNPIYGSDTELTFMGMTRHDWGSIHLIISLIFLFLLLLHIILHWKIIGCLFRRLFSMRGLRRALALVFTLICLGFLVVPWFIDPEVIPLERKHRGERVQQSVTSKNEFPEKKATSIVLTRQDAEVRLNEEPKHQYQLNREIEVYGYMTLEEVAEQYDVPVHKLAQAIKIPDSETNYRLGRLKKHYDFHMSDVKEAVLENMKP